MSRRIIEQSQKRETSMLVDHVMAKLRILREEEKDVKNLRFLIGLMEEFKITNKKTTLECQANPSSRRIIRTPRQHAAPRLQNWAYRRECSHKMLYIKLLPEATFLSLFSVASPRSASFIDE